MNAARGPRAYSRARVVAAFTSRVLARLAVTAGLAVLGWLLTLLFSSSASAAEPDDGAGDRGLFGGVVGGVTDTTTNVVGGTLDTVDSATNGLTSTVTKTVDATVEAVTDTLDTAARTVDNTVGAVTGVVDDTVYVVSPAPEAPAAQPVAVTPVAEAPAVKKVTKAAPADRPERSDRAAVRSDLARPEVTGTQVADLPRAAGSTSAAGSADSTPFGSKLPTAPACGTAAAAVAADQAGKKLFALPADQAWSGSLQQLGLGSPQPAAATVAAAALPCTSPD